MIFVASKELGVQVPRAMPVEDVDSDEAVAERIVLLRQTVKPGFNSRQFAEFLGVLPQRLNNVELGGPLGRDLAATIRRKVPGVTMDWLYFGDMRGLHFELAQRLSEASEKTKTRAS